MKGKHSKKYKSLFSKFIVILVVMMNIGFTLAVLYLSRGDHKVPDSLIAAWFSFTTGELWLLSNIKKTKIKNNAINTVVDDSSNSGPS